jgi:hypothetical protein
MDGEEFHFPKRFRELSVGIGQNLVLGEHEDGLDLAVLHGRKQLSGAQPRLVGDAVPPRLA